MKEDALVLVLYRTRPGQLLMKCFMRLHADRLLVWFLRSRLSALIVPTFIRKNRIDLSRFAEHTFPTYRDLFLRHKKELVFDGEKTHLVSPCDAYLSAYRIGEGSRFRIKGTRYTVRELLGLSEEAEKMHPGKEGTSLLSSFAGGCALVFRLCASDYHHYHYFDDCVQRKHHFIEGELHSVQPSACAAYPVYVRNRRTVSVLETAHFGTVIQIEVGAFVVGGIVNHYDGGTHERGEEKGHFDLSGSTIVLLFEKDCVKLRADFRDRILRGEEIRVETGERIGKSAI